MGYGVFRRRPDYEIRPRRVLPLAVAAAAVVGPTLFARPQLPQPEQVRQEFYQRRRVLPPRAGGGPPAGPQQKRLHPVPATEVFRKPWDYWVRPRRLPGLATVVAPSVGPTLRQRPPPIIEPTPWDYRLRHLRKPITITAPVVTFGPTLRAKPPPPTIDPPRFSEYFRRKIILPDVHEPIIPAGRVYRQKPPLRVDLFIRPWDYAGRGTGRKLISPRLPAAAVTAGVEYASRGHYDQGRGLYHTPVVETGEPYFSGAIAVAQSIPDATETVVAMLPQTDKDPWGLFDAVNSSIVIRYPGTYLYGAQIVWATDAVGIREVAVMQYTSANVLIGRAVSNRVNAVSAGDTNQSVVRLSPLQSAIGSYFRMEVTQTSGGPLDLDGALMWMVRIGPIDLILPT